MRTEKTIRKRLEEVDGKLKSGKLTPEQWDIYHALFWELRWVLGETLNQFSPSQTHTRQEA